MFILPKDYYRKNLKLAIPIMLSLVCQSLAQVADTLMVGRLSAVSLAAVSFSTAITSVALVMGIGLAIAITPLISKAFAKTQENKIVNFLTNGLYVNIILSLILIALLFTLLPLFPYFGQSKDVILAARPYYIIVVISLFPNQIFLCLKQFLEGLMNTKAAMVIVISSNILNIILNFIFIYGYCGFPAMGVTGAALATFISRLLSPIALFLYIRYKQNYWKYVRLIKIRNLRKLVIKSIMRIGIPICGQMTIECFAFGALTFFFGWVSVIDMAAYQIVMTMVTLTFHCCIGFANATTILTSFYVGRDEWYEVRRYSKTGFHLAVAFMFCSMLCFIFAGKYIASLFSADESVILIASKLFIVAGIFQILDGSQGTLLGALRGLQSVTRPMYYACFSYLCVSLPAAYLLCFGFSLPSWTILAGFAFGMLVVTLLYYGQLTKILRLNVNNSL
ncbi:MAG: MATE family efflux transporter [Bacteroidales bacterium]|jgi:MATE family multidrug resistance protein|nr:MATE family efflux transporter [Bacteroidales bacterium]